MRTSATTQARSRAPSPTPRRIVHRTRGVRHGPIVRLVSPSDLGELIKPFVFLDYIDIDTKNAPQFGYHPHSGIATLTLLLEGGFTYEDSTGAKGNLSEGSVEWMQAGGGVWHTGEAVGPRVKGYQLWLALPPETESAAAFCAAVQPQSFPQAGPARVILGNLGNAHSPIVAPAPMDYLDVRLRAGEVWRYEPAPGHNVAWVAVHEGTALAPQPISAGELAVFEESQESIEFKAQGDTSFVLGSARKHPHDLVLGHYSVHTNAAALERGESNIRRIGAQLSKRIQS
jgi:redox-sensitive bicupin YhaK (pirin superfamily)